MTFAENLCLVTRQDDPEFSSFVYWVIDSLIYAEELGITQATSNRMPDVKLLGPDFSKIFRDAVFVVGNYGEIYDRNLGSILNRSGTRNLLNNNSGPQLYIPPGFDFPTL